MPTQPQPQAPQPSLIQLTRPEQRTIQTQSPVSTFAQRSIWQSPQRFFTLRPFVSSPRPTQVTIPPAPPASPLPVSGRFPRPVGPLGSSVQNGVVSAWLSTGSGFVVIKDSVNRATEFVFRWVHMVTFGRSAGAPRGAIPLGEEDVRGSHCNPSRRE